MTTCIPGGSNPPLSASFPATSCETREQGGSKNSPPTMRRVCMRCGVFLGTKPCLPEQDGLTTHGCCEACAKTILDDAASVEDLKGPTSPRENGTAAPASAAALDHPSGSPAASSNRSLRFRPSRVNRHRWKSVRLSQRVYTLNGRRWRVELIEVHKGAKPYQRPDGVSEHVRIVEKYISFFGWHLVRGSRTDRAERRAA
jgi:hypothetical protein